MFDIAGNSGRVLLFSFGALDSGVPYSWQASRNRAGINVLKDLSERTLHQLENQVNAFRREGDVVIVSIHWGSNWGYPIPDEQQYFARGLIDGNIADIIHGHSSHHPKGIEIYRNRPIIYGCGDFINDYEGISGHERYRSDLCLMYFLTLDTAGGELVRLELVPMQIKNLRVNRADYHDASWLADMLNRQGVYLGTRVRLQDDGTMSVVPA